jgi:hypothetical protein
MYLLDDLGTILGSLFQNQLDGKHMGGGSYPIKIAYFSLTSND